MKAMLLRRMMPRGAVRARLNAPVYSMLDGFTIANGAPIPSPLTADGVGSWNKTDDGDYMAVVPSAGLVFSGNTSPGNPGLWSANTISIGQGFFVKASAMQGANNQRFQIGMDNNTAGVGSGGAPQIAFNAGNLMVYNNGFTGTLIAGISNDVLYEFGFGAMNGYTVYLYKDGGSWRIGWVGNSMMVGNSWYAAISGVTTADATVRRYAAGHLAGKWANDYGVATDRAAGAVSAGTALLAGSDVVIYCPDVGTITGTAKVIRYRMAGDAYLQLTMDSTSVDLDYYDGVTTTELATASPVASNSQIRVFVEGVNTTVWGGNSILFTYGSTPLIYGVGVRYQSGANLTGDLLTLPAVLSGVTRDYWEAA